MTRPTIVAAPTGDVLRLDELRATITRTLGAHPGPVDLFVTSPAWGLAPWDWELCDHVEDTGTPVFCDAPTFALIKVPEGGWEGRCPEHAPATVTPKVPHRLLAVPTNGEADLAAAQEVIDRIADAALCGWFLSEYRGHNVADLVSAGLSEAARYIGGSDALTAHRSGSWEASHVQALAARHDHHQQQVWS